MSQLKSFVFTGVPRRVSSTPLFSISPALSVMVVKPVDGVTETGNIWSRLFDLYQVKFTPNLSLKKERSVPISNVSVLSGFNVAIPAAPDLDQPITSFTGLSNDGVYTILVL